MKNSLYFSSGFEGERIPKFLISPLEYFSKILSTSTENTEKTGKSAGSETNSS